MNNSQIARRMQSVRPSPTAVISDQVRALEAAGKPVINLGEGELDFATPAHISYAGIEAIVHHQTKYTAVSGTTALKEAIAAKFARDNQLHYRPQEIIAGSGAKQLIFNAFLATLDAGQQVIIPAPYWVSYPDMVSLADGEPVIVPCDEQNGWKLTPEQLAAALTPSTRWLILNSPGNPTGAIYSEQELRALAAVLADYPQVLVMADDIYEPLRYDNIPFTTFAQAAPQMVSRTLTVNGVSKSHAMTGWRLGYAGGPQWLIAAMQILQSQSTSNPSSISQAAAVAALNHSANFFDGWLNVLDKRRQQVLGMIAATDGLSATAPQGAFYVFANCQALMGRMTPGGEILRNDSALANWLLEQTQVAVLHGSAFGMPGYLRIAYAVEDGLLTQACQRIAGACAQLR
ncbi:pyridoxal phosphate-dependent aminotransferase [Klebsiella variicola]|uniref:pyridoxal phosphate-dependent aminotransferase n=1 Tax=Klebsiella variicola TaxID=244366 RepID=UPI00236F2AC1|nr:pyridoxal phosphate-dependent aminotransferase [Klebsiella variicola]EKW4787845.1 pyridoxal phosphate-dependent aminotransferase [Klebsiella variicola]MDZ0820223.1 pyridoxal phosphate-dependent aminotransferase [Klebsiella variicola]HDK6287112.1 pyridoxal phosphate-dependent aminotransferase [Klebsiella variicola]